MKIRLAKHTRALAAALAFCVLSAVPAYAQEDDTVEVPGVPVTLSLPAGSLILTRETPVDDAIFETLNVDGAAILENMNKTICIWTPFFLNLLWSLPLSAFNSLPTA